MKLSKVDGITQLDRCKVYSRIENSCLHRCLTYRHVIQFFKLGLEWTTFNIYMWIQNILSCFIWNGNCYSSQIFRVKAMFLLWCNIKGTPFAVNEGLIGEWIWQKCLHFLMSQRFSLIYQNMTKTMTSTMLPRVLISPQVQVLCIGSIFFTSISS